VYAVAAAVAPMPVVVAGFVEAGMGCSQLPMMQSYSLMTSAEGFAM